MIFTPRIDLKLRHSLWRAYDLFSPIIAKIGIHKIKMRGYTLGNRMHLLIHKLLNFKPAEPIQSKGIIMYYSTSDGRGWFGWGYAFDYEPQTYQVLQQVVKRGMTVVDVGAHIGYYALISAKIVGTTGRVYAFEPDPSYYALLKKNIEINGLDAIIEPFKLAIGNTEKKSTLFLGRSTETSLFKISDIALQTDIVDVISLDKFFADRDWPSVDVLKMDIEGAEKLALEGMRRLVRKNPLLKLIIEFNPSLLELAGTSVKELTILLSQLGFNVLRLLSGKTQTFPEPSPRYEIYKIPHDIQYLENFIRKPNIVNLLCERNP